MNSKYKLYHHGILGMKWGVRRYQNKDGSLTKAGKERYTINSKTNTGETISLVKDTPITAKIVSRLSKKGRENAERFTSFTIKNVHDKRVGDIQMFEVSKDELNLVWLGIDQKSRGHGYAQAVMDVAIDYAKSNNYKSVTLEVPGNSPDARHIYEKKGFKETGVLTTPEEDDYWGGLTKMEYRIKNREEIK